MDIGTVPAHPTGIVKYGDALYVSAHLPARAEPKEGTPDWENPPRGVFELTASGTKQLTKMSYPRVLAVCADYIWTWDYLTARGSATESAALLDVCRRLKLVGEADHRAGKEQITRIVSMLIKLAMSLEDTKADTRE